jgi:hypothetical protein
LLGDSFLLGHTVLPRHHFARALEPLISEATGEPVHALNFAKADFDFQDMYLYFRDFAGTFDYDLALFFVDEGDLAPVRKGAPGLQPTVALVGDALVANRTFRESEVFRFYRSIEPVMTRSAALRLAFNASKMVNRGELDDVLLDKFAPALARALRAPGSLPRRRATSPQTLPLNEVCRAVLRELREDPRNVLVIQKTLPPTLEEEVRLAGLPILDLGAALAALEFRGEDPYYWPVTKVRGHWNHEAHQEIARFLALELARQRLLWPVVPAAGATQRPQ